MVLFHEPVLLKESIDFLITDLSGTYVDATFGGGGHTRELLSRLNSDAGVVAFDVDDNSRRIAEELVSSDNRLSFVQKNFSQIKNLFSERIASRGDMNSESSRGFIFDLGVSSYQIDSEPGFSYRRDERLDMRLDKNLKISAYEVVNSYSVERLIEVFSNYGEEPRSRTLARAIVKSRGKRKIETTSQLADIIGGVCGKSTKTLSRIFQALRIEVNDELSSLSRGLEAAMELTGRGGRIVAISYHSLEDRIVKEKFKYEAATCVCPPQAIICTCGKIARARILTRKPILPGPEEIVRNRRARSAKMRVAEKII
jgi:16S rRNA (cytosine1402-N4)-methyltransferase